MKVGDRVDYYPRDLRDMDKPVKDAEITMYEPRGSIFNQPMAVIEGVEHWVPVYDLVLAGEPEPEPPSITITLKEYDKCQ